MLSKWGTCSLYGIYMVKRLCVTHEIVREIGSCWVGRSGQKENDAYGRGVPCNGDTISLRSCFVN